MTIGAPLASAWTKVYTPRTVTLIGGTLLLLANTLASLSTQLWHFLLAQGVLLGCATCLSYIPAVTIAPGWFDARRGLAMGIILSGTGVGGVVWAPALRALNAAIGFRNTLRLTGGIGFVLVSAAAMALEWDPASAARIAAERPSPPSRRPARRSRLFSVLGSALRTRIPLVNWRIANSRLFVAEAAGAALQAAAYYTPVYFFSSYARSLGYSAAAGASFIAASNASSAVGKVLLGYTADRAGRLNTLLFCTLVSAATALGLWFPSTRAEQEGEGEGFGGEWPGARAVRRVCGAVWRVCGRVRESVPDGAGGAVWGAEFRQRERIPVHGARIWHAVGDAGCWGADPFGWGEGSGWVREWRTGSGGVCEE